MARSRAPKFEASEVITNEIVRIIERGVLPWRKPWTAGGSSRPLRVGRFRRPMLWMQTLRGGLLWSEQKRRRRRG